MGLKQSRIVRSRNFGYSFGLKYALSSSTSPNLIMVPVTVPIPSLIPVQISVLILISISVLVLQRYSSSLIPIPPPIPNSVTVKSSDRIAGSGHEFRHLSDCDSNLYAVSRTKPYPNLGLGPNPDSDSEFEAGCRFDPGSWTRWSVWHTSSSTPLSWVVVSARIPSC